MLTLYLLNPRIISDLEKSAESCFFPTGPLYLQIFVHKCDLSVTYVFSIIGNYSIHKFPLGFMDGFIDQIGLGCLTTLNTIQLIR